MKSKLSVSMMSLCAFTTLHAEVTLDGTLGPQMNLEGPNYAIGAELGQQRGGNLFHSFAKLNVNTGDSATFSGPENVTNVIGRVTGGTASNIDGALRSTIPNADLYLINPAGMVFGPNATLDVPGSFHASTADTLRFQDGSEFNARSPTNSVLTVAPVQAFGFVGDSPAALTVEGNTNMTATAGKTLSLVGGHLKIYQSKVAVSGGRLNLASVSSKGDVTPQPADLTSSASPGEMTVQESIVSVSGGGTQGGIYIRAGRFTLTEASVQANASKEQDGGRIDVQADSVTATGGRFLSSTAGAGHSGKVTLKVNGATEFIGANSKGVASGIITGAAENSQGNAGTIEIETGTLSLKDGANLNATTQGSGQGGNIVVRAKEGVTLSGTDSGKKQGSSIAANTRAKENGGAGGTIVLQAKELTLNDGAVITSTTLGSGAGGSVNIQVTEGVNLAGADQRDPRRTSSISALTGGTGNGGTLTISARTLNVSNGTMIRADSGGSGKGGNIAIQVSDTVNLAGTDSTGYGSLISANASGRNADAGEGGTLFLIANRLNLADGAQVGTSTFGPGQGGKLIIQVAGETKLSGQDQSADRFSSGLFTVSQGETDPAGAGGTLVLQTGNLILTETGTISAKTFGPARGGNVQIQAQSASLTKGGLVTARSENRGEAGQILMMVGDTLNMRNSSIQTSALSADGGDLIITAPNYVYLIGSQISTSVSEEFGGGGNIVFQPKFVILDGSQIFAKAKKGHGGNIGIVTTGVYNFTYESIAKVINASSEMGVDGVVTITTPDQSAVEGLFALPAGMLDVTGLMKTPCGQRDNSSSFVLLEREGTPTPPNDLLASGPRLTPSPPVSSRPAKITIQPRVANADQTAKTHHPTALLMVECKAKGR